ncbi:hypothetical protein FACS189468_5340 [Spirochaetia bacterium]|nr:hypothetical protein FACS189468_5340 [Spirochaetia bacterium]
MPWRLIVFILIFGLFLGFIGLNLENTCDISFGFTVIRGVPVYLTAFSSFIIGLLWSLPLVITRLKKKGRPKGTAVGSPEARPLRKIRKGKGKNPDTPPKGTEGDDGPYGID